MGDLIIPENTLYRFISNMFRGLKLDYENKLAANEVVDSILYRMLNGETDGDYNFYDQAVDLFTRDDNHARKVSIRRGFDKQKADIPTVFIILADENTGNNTLGVGNDSTSESFYTNTDGSLVPKHSRRMITTYHIMCTSDNSRETLLLYHITRALLVAGLDQADLDGIRNAALSGRDLQNYMKNVPQHIYMRAVGIKCFYDVVTPSNTVHQIITQLNQEPTVST